MLLFVEKLEYKEYDLTPNDAVYSGRQVSRFRDMFQTVMYLVLFLICKRACV